jgi:quercetin dioxygenase-like cupin family protein
MVVNLLPFTEERSGGVRIRTFSASTDADELVWHRDDEDRNIFVVESDGWYFQRDGELPREMKPGDSILVTRNEWHRVISRKPTRLVVEIRTRH